MNRQFYRQQQSPVHTPLEIALHNTACPDTQTVPNLVNNWFRNLRSGWVDHNVDGYHVLIDRQGVAWQLGDFRRQCWGVGDLNNGLIHIAVIGNYTNRAIPDVAKRTLERVVADIRRDFNINRIRGHNQFPRTANFNHPVNSCPGTINQLIPSLLNKSQTAPQNPTNTTTRFINHRVPLRERASAKSKQVGQHLEIGHEVRLLGNTVRSNNKLGNWINITTGARQGWVRSSRLSTTRPVASKDQAIKVGSRVRVNNNAQSWATGQSIPTWVRGQSYTVQQVRNNNNELLLAGIISWIRRSDVTAV